MFTSLLFIIPPIIFCGQVWLSTLRTYPWSSICLGLFSYWIFACAQNQSSSFSLHCTSILLFLFWPSLHLPIPVDCPTDWKSPSVTLTIMRTLCPCQEGPFEMVPTFPFFRHLNGAEVLQHSKWGRGSDYLLETFTTFFSLETSTTFFHLDSPNS